MSSRVDFLRRASDEGWDFAQVLAQGLEAGWPAAELLPYVVPDWEWAGYDEDRDVLVVSVSEEDWVDALIAVLGSIEAAQAAVHAAGAPACWDDQSTEPPLDLQAWLQRREQERQAQERLRALVYGHAPFDQLAAALSGDQVLPVARVWWWSEATRGRPLRALLDTEHVPADVLERALRGRGDRLALLLELRATAPREDFLRLGPRLLQIPDSAAQTEVELLLRGAAERGASLWQVWEVLSEREAPSTWLAAFRREGFNANAAALACMEVGLSSAATGVAMSAAGYADGQVLEGLRANGAGTDPSLRALAEDGWRPERLAEMMREAGALEPEVREALRCVVGERGA